MSDKAANACLPALKCIPDWFVQNKILEIIDDTAFSNVEIDLP